MKKIFSKAFVLGFVSLLGFNSHAQVRIDTFKVNGDIDKYYVVSFFDGGWLSNVATDLEIGRASTNTDGSNSGSMIGKFRFHVGNSVHGAGFIDGDLRQSNLATPSKGFFVGGWRDVSEDNSAATIVIWLRGNTTYFYKSSFPVAPRVYDSTHVYDGTLFSKNYKPGGITYTVKTAVDKYVNTYGLSYGNTAYFNGSGTNYFSGNVGVGTTSVGTYKLAVEGTIRARRIKVDGDTWADYVFEPDYRLPSLQEVETYIKENKHLPDVPSAKEAASKGLDLGEMNKILLQKIEELTLHLIEQGKELDKVKQEVTVLKNGKK